MRRHCKSGRHGDTLAHGALSSLRALGRLPHRCVLLHLQAVLLHDPRVLLHLLRNVLESRRVDDGSIALPVVPVAQHVLAARVLRRVGVTPVRVLDQHPMGHQDFDARQGHHV